MKLDEIEILLLDESDKVGVYSCKVNGSDLSEFERFLQKYKDSEHQEAIATIMARIVRLKEDGCYERYFRYEGARKDRLFALPSHYDVGNLRIFCLVLSPNILILGNGGLKTTRTYNEDAWLYSCADFLQRLDKKIKYFEKSGILTLEGKTIKGKTLFKMKRNEKE